MCILVLVHGDGSWWYNEERGEQEKQFSNYTFLLIKFKKQLHYVLPKHPKGFELPLPPRTIATNETFDHFLHACHLCSCSFYFIRRWRRSSSTPQWPCQNFGTSCLGSTRTSSLGRATADFRGEHLLVFGPAKPRRMTDPCFFSSLYKMLQMGWVNFSMEASMSLSMSLSMSMMPHPSTKTSKSQGPKGDYHGRGSTGPIVTHSMGGMDGSHADESIPEVASDVDDHKVWVKRSHVQDDHDSMKLVKT